MQPIGVLAADGDAQRFAILETSVIGRADVDVET